MDCQLCGKRPASIHFTELSSGSAVESHICQECAQAKGLFKPAAVKMKFSVSDFLAGIGPIAGSSESPAVEARCPVCGETYGEFRESGRLWCGECYVAFAEFLRPLLRRVHGSAHHTGKRPPGARPAGGGEIAELKHLRDDLRRALDREDFERCAELRDRIRRAERKAGAP